MEGNAEQPGVTWQLGKELALFVVLTAVYVIAGKLGLQLAFLQPFASPVWAPTGIALAAFIIFGYRVWPSILLGAFLVNLTNDNSLAAPLSSAVANAWQQIWLLITNISATVPAATTLGTSLTSIARELGVFLASSLTASSTPVAFGIATGNMLEGLLGAYLVNKFAHGRYAFDQPRDVLLFVLLAGLLSTMLGATLGVASLSWQGLSPWYNFRPVWFTWWLGDVGGAMIVAPLLIVWSNKWRSRWSRRQVLEAMLMLACLALVAQVLFGSPLAPLARTYSLEFLVIPFLIWAAFRFGQRGATIAIVTLAGIAIWHTVAGSGPFVGPTINDSLLQLQAFIAVNTFMVLLLGTLVAKGRLSEQRFRDLIEHSFEAIFLLSPQAKIYYSSPSTKRVLGYDPDELLGHEGLTLFEPEQRERVEILLADLATTPGRTITMEARLKRKDGKWIWVESTATNLLDEPTVQAIVVNYRDITERKEAGQNLELYIAKLAEEKAKDEALIASLGDGIIATDQHGKIIRVNRAFERLMGIEAEDAVGKSTTDVIPIQDEQGQVLPDDQRALRLALKTNQRVSVTHYLVRRDGTKFPATVTATPITLDGDIIGAIEALHDITKEKEIDKAKTEFVALASHQLRGPLAAVSWYSEALLAGSQEHLGEAQKKYLEVISSSNQRMINLVNALLNVSRLELGTFMVAPELTDVIKLAKTIVEEAQPKLKEKQLVFTTRFGELLQIQADPKLTWTILSSLLENAIKYTPRGGKVGFEVARKRAGEEVGGRKLDEDSVIFIVSDTGCGIPLAQQDRIFTKFFRADNAVRMDPDGNGLGLYIVKSVLGHLGGEVWFESVEKKGTTFYLRLPLKGMPKKEGTKRLA